MTALRTTPAVPATLPPDLHPTHNRAAVAALGDEVIDWRFKGLPVSLDGCTVRRAGELRLDLLGGEFLGPILALDRPALMSNIEVFARWCRLHEVKLAPHGKTTMAPWIWGRQLDLGAWGLTAANAAQLRVYRRFGVRRVIVANQIVDRAALAWIDQERRLDPVFEVSVFVDSVDGVRAMNAALATIEAPEPLDVVVEYGRQSGRAGVRSVAAGLEVARAVAASRHLRLVGVGGYEGTLVNDASPESLAVIDEFLNGLCDLVVGLHDRNAFETDKVLVTAGGSCFFDQVAAALTRRWPAGLRVVPVLRSSCYVTHDAGFYDSMSAFSRTTVAPNPLRPAMQMWARATSRPEPDLALLTAGKRDLSFDAWLPGAGAVRSSDGTVRPLTDSRVEAVNDQHAFVRLGDGDEVAVGDWVRLDQSYPCTAFDKWQLIPLVECGRVVDFVRTFF